MSKYKKLRKNSSKRIYQTKQIMDARFQQMLATYGQNIVDECAAKYGFDAVEAASQLNFTVLQQTRRPRAAGTGKFEKRNAAPKPAFPLPWTGVPNTTWCQGLRLNHGLCSQCTNEPSSETDFCKTCTRTSTPYGTVTQRQQCDTMAYANPKNGKQVIPYANVMKKLNLTREQVTDEATKFGLTIPDEQFVERIVQRGRPKVAKAEGEVAVNDTPKKRGRPKKEKRVVTANVGDDLIAQLAAQVNSSSPAAAPAIVHSLIPTSSPTHITLKLPAAAPKVPKAPKTGFDALTIAQLKQICKSQALLVGGTKPVLITRLTEKGLTPEQFIVQPTVSAIASPTATVSPSSPNLEMSTSQVVNQAGLEVAAQVAKQAELDALAQVAKQQAEAESAALLAKQQAEANAAALLAKQQAEAESAALLAKQQAEAESAALLAKQQAEAESAALLAKQQAEANAAALLAKQQAEAESAKQAEANAAKQHIRFANNDDDSEEEDDSDDDETEVEVTEITIDGQKYYQASDNTIYNQSSEVVGRVVDSVPSLY
jgi:hypothetical protein